MISSLATPVFEVVQPSELEARGADADYVLLAAGITEQTFRKFDKPLLEKMKPTAFLLNVGRGQLSETALAWVFMSGPRCSFLRVSGDPSAAPSPPPGTGTGISALSTPGILGIPALSASPLPRPGTGIPVP